MLYGVKTTKTETIGGGRRRGNEDTVVCSWTDETRQSKERIHQRVNTCAYIGLGTRQERQD